MSANKKMLAARKALIRFYADIQRRAAGKKFTAKMRAATITLAAMYESLRDRLRERNEYESLTCVCKIDRVILTTNTLSWKAIFGVLGWRPRRRKRHWRKDYRFSRRIRGTGSIAEVVVEFERTAAWFPHFRITVIPQDDTGLLHHDFQWLLQALPDAEIKVVEVAWDFPNRCVVDLDYVRRFGLFGSTWLRPGSNPYHDKWGNVGSKIVRAYVKWGTSQFRVELELHVRLLRQLGINDIFDFRKLRSALFPDHIHFLKLDEMKLVRALRRAGLALAEQRAVRTRVKTKVQRSLWDGLRYLREEVGLKNVQRLLLPVPEMNREVHIALEGLVAQWPRRPTTGSQP